MSALELSKQLDDLKIVTLTDGEVWSARDLMSFAGYNRWENWSKAINRAIASVNASGLDASDHFRGVTKMVQIGSGSRREIEDVELTRYACYILFQNADGAKPEIAALQQYFAVQTRKQEVAAPVAEISRRDLALAVLAAEDEADRQRARAEVAEEFKTAIESNLGLPPREFNKKYFADVPEREFFETLYRTGLLIDQRQKGTQREDGSWRDGSQHRHPTYKGKSFFYLSSGVNRNGYRFENTLVRPGQPELDLVEFLSRRGYAPTTKELTA